MMEFDSNYSRRILIRLIIVLVVLVAVLILSREFIYDFYIRGQITPAGYIINAATILLFIGGLIQIVAGLRHYAREEAALARFIRSVDDEQLDVTTGIDPSSLIHQRYAAIMRVSQQHSPINHGALTSMLLAEESKRLTFPRYVNTILILMGVLGTIIGLAIALVGAADLLEAERDLGSMDVLIHGMSVAPAATITAIVCYLIFGYFYLKLHDAQTHLIHGVEQVTSLYLLPKYSRGADSILHEVYSLVDRLREVAEGMRGSHSDYAEAGIRLRETVNDYSQIGHRMSIILADLEARMGGVTDDVRIIKRMLRDGFRLPAEDTR